ncbi:uncharacterized protein J3R85_016905 [Psidium guajava]|nr:uncharacterized protein J3R85_016905 [Psidium guajava]
MVDCSDQTIPQLTFESAGVDDVWMAIPAEARNNELGEAQYYAVLVWNAIIWQFFFLGAVGIIFYASSLFTGILIAILLPITEILAVIIYQEKFHAEKGVSLALSLWAFASYFCGEFELGKKENENAAAAAAEAEEED